MKKLLFIILIASIVSPAFAFADDGHDRKRDNDSRKMSHLAEKSEKKEKREEKKYREVKKEKDDDHDEKKYRQSTTTNQQIPKKINYFLCKTDGVWNVVALEGEKNKNSARALGKRCIKLPYGFVKKFYNNHATTTPDVLAPVISLVSATSITPTTASISWTTNEIAKGNVYFSTTTPVNLATAQTLGNPAYMTAHSFNLTGLSASTTYYYVVKSSDLSNNIATSSQYSFVTTAIPDTTAPVISSVAVSALASTTATVSWNTNELATGKLFYGTSTPLTTFVYNPTPSLAHTLNLTGLSASTTYQLLLESKDASGNTATTTSSFVTTI